MYYFTLADKITLFLSTVVRRNGMWSLWKVKRLIAKENVKVRGIKRNDTIAYSENESGHFTQWVLDTTFFRNLFCPFLCTKSTMKIYRNTILTSRNSLRDFWHLCSWSKSVTKVFLMPDWATSDNTRLSFETSCMMALNSKNIFKI